MAETTTAPTNKAVAFSGKPKKRATNKAITRKRARSAIKRGMISEKAAKRHLGGEY